MATPSNNPPAPNRHSKQPSLGRVGIARRSTKGPLDLEETPIFTNPHSPSSSQILSPPLSGKRPSLSPRASLAGQTYSPKDFGRLLRPEIYHPLNQLEIPPAFRSSSQQPAPDTPIQTLLSTGHFRSAAIRAAQQLTTSTAPSDYQSIFELIYIRLICLNLSGSTALAVQEVKALEDLNSSAYRNDLDGTHLVPWELRVLAVRLQGMGFNDPRRCVMGYYDLAREARAEMAKLKDTLYVDDAKASWAHKLEDLGIRVASALVEMEDLDGAAYHLSTLRSTLDPQLALTKALLWLHLGDLAAARRCVSGDADIDAVVAALSNMADGKYVAAVEQWRDLHERNGDDEMYAQNLAVCLLYTGRLDEARSILESLIDSGKSFHALTFNLSTVYELCTDRSRALKTQLAERVAAHPSDNGDGWEKLNIDFKL